MTDMTQYFHESNLIEGFYSAEADECLNQAWEYLIKQKKLSDDVIKKVQYLATYHQRDLKPEWRGEYRKIPVYIGGREAPNPVTVTNLMQGWLWRMNDEEHLKPIPMHIDFEHIHPFVDGNGRTGRLLFWWHQLKIGEEPTLIKFKYRQDYYRWFK